MRTQEFFEQIAVIVALMGGLALSELVLPLRPRKLLAPGRRRVNLTLTALAFALNWGLSLGLLLVAAPFGPASRGPLAALGAGLLTEVVISIVVLDFFTYAAHVSMHRIPLLWRVHRVHHSDPFVDVSTTYRFHPLEVLWRYTWTFAPALALGLPVQGIVTYRLLSVMNGVFEHANVRIWTWLDRLLSSVWVTPNYHKVHHFSLRDHANSNYGNIFTFYDRFFRTFRSAERAHEVPYGLEAFAPTSLKSIRSVLSIPFELSSGSRSSELTHGDSR